MGWRTAAIEEPPNHKFALGLPRATNLGKIMSLRFGVRPGDVNGQLVLCHQDRFGERIMGEEEGPGHNGRGPGICRT